jgi:hypothetical protein
MFLYFGLADLVPEGSHAYDERGLAKRTGNAAFIEIAMRCFLARSVVL